MQSWYARTCQKNMDHEDHERSSVVLKLLSTTFFMERYAVISDWYCILIFRLDCCIVVLRLYFRVETQKYAKVTAELEFKVKAFAELLTEAIEETCSYIDKKQTRTHEEIQV